MYGYAHFHQGGCWFTIFVFLSVVGFVCMRKNYRRDCQDALWVRDELIRFWCGSGSGRQIQEFIFTFPLSLWDFSSFSPCALLTAVARHNCHSTFLFTQLQVHQLHPTFLRKLLIQMDADSKAPLDCVILRHISIYLFNGPSDLNALETSLETHFSLTQITASNIRSIPATGHRGWETLSLVHFRAVSYHMIWL